MARVCDTNLSKPSESGSVHKKWSIENNVKKDKITVLYCVYYVGGFEGVH